MDLSEYEGQALPLEHVDYPHEPGRLYDCPACEAECWCTGRPGDTQCVFCALLEEGGVMTDKSGYGEWTPEAGKRVELHPRLDAWMLGDRFGEVVEVGRKWVHIKMDRSGKVRKVAPDDLQELL